MPAPIELCLEDLLALPGSPEYLQCVARQGSGPGLTVGLDGGVRWESAEAAAFELWVSADEKLVLRRREGAPEVSVARRGRAVRAPEGKPVVLLDQDEIALGARRWRLHVHGFAPQAHAPRPLLRRALAPLAAAAALGAAACSESSAAAPRKAAPEPIEVRMRPPDVAPPEPPPAPPDAGSPAPVPKPTTHPR